MTPTATEIPTALTETPAATDTPTPIGDSSSRDVPDGLGATPAPTADGGAVVTTPSSSDNNLIKTLRVFVRFLTIWWTLKTPDVDPGGSPTREISCNSVRPRRGTQT